MSSLADDLDTLRIPGLPPADGPEPGSAGGEEESELAGEAPEPLEQAPAEPRTLPLESLAEKVYALLKQELRLERERLVRNRPW